MSILHGAQSHYRLFGTRGLALVALARLRREPLEVAVDLAGIARPLRLRLRTTDVSVYEEIVICGEYHIDLPSPPRVIVDAGANIGMTSIYFANRYPDATIIAVEPEPSNFDMLVKNAAGYLNIRPVRAALWKDDTEVVLSDPGAGPWGFQTRERGESGSDAVTAPATTVDRLMREHGVDRIDVLKMDIEGSEVEVFDTSADWIERVGTIIVELHDRSRPGCSRSAYRATKDFPLSWSRGETTFFQRTASTSPPDARDADASAPGPRPRKDRRRAALMTHTSAS